MCVFSGLPPQWIRVGEDLENKQTHLTQAALITVPLTWKSERLSKVEGDRSLQFLRIPDWKGEDFWVCCTPREGCGRQTDEPCAPAFQEIV